jgi:hypothetical protein
VAKKAREGACGEAVDASDDVGEHDIFIRGTGARAGLEGSGRLRRWMKRDRVIPETER